MRDRLRVFTGLAERDDVIRKPLTAHGAVLADLFVQQPQRFRTLHFSDGVLPDRDLRMEDKADGSERPNNIATKILDTDKAVAAFHRGQVHAMNADQPPGHDHAEQFVDQVMEMLLELRAVAAVAHITIAVGVGVQACKRRGKDGVVNAVFRQTAHGFHAVALIKGVTISDGLIKHIHDEIPPMRDTAFEYQGCTGL